MVIAMNWDRVRRFGSLVHVLKTAEKETRATRFPTPHNQLCLWSNLKTAFTRPTMLRLLLPTFGDHLALPK